MLIIEGDSLLRFSGFAFRRNLKTTLTYSNAAFQMRTWATQFSYIILHSFIPFFLFFDFSQQIDSSYINIYQILWNYFSLYVLCDVMICYKVRWWPFLFNGYLMIMLNVIHNHFYDYFITITLIQLEWWTLSGAEGKRDQHSTICQRHVFTVSMENSNRNRWTEFGALVSANNDLLHYFTKKHIAILQRF